MAARAERRTANLVAAIATIAACDISMGLTFSLVPLLLEDRGTPAWLIGLNAALGPLGILCAGPLLPRAVAVFGSKRLATIAIAVICASLFAYNLFPSLAAWFVIRLVFGIASGALFTISEAWILTIAADGTRGRIMGLYTSVLSVTFAVGPLIIPWTGIYGWMPWLIGIAFVIASTLPLAAIAVDEAVFREEKRHGFFGFMAKAPLLLLGVAAVTFCDSVILSFFQIWGLRHGMDLGTVSTILGLAIIGNALLQYPIGMLADRWSRLGVIVSAAATTVVLALALIWVVGTWAIWPVAIVLGTSAFAIYTVSLAIVGDRFQGPDLIAGSAAFAAMWGLSGMIGPALTGAAIDLFGIDAVPVMLAAPFIALLIAIAATGGRLIRGAQAAAE